MQEFFGKCLTAMVFAGLMISQAQAEETLEEQVQSLSRQNRVQSEMLQDLQRRIEDKGEGQESLLQVLFDRLEFNGLMEVEAYSSEDFNGDETSDIDLATVELDIHGRINNWSSAHLLLKYEERDNDDDFFVDEGTITIGNQAEFPVLLIAGKMYIHFGGYNSNMISDPLTLELGETNVDALQVVTEMNGLYSTLYVFNGDTDETGKDDAIRSFGINGGYTMVRDNLSLEVGFDWLNNLADSNGLGEHIATTSGTIGDQVAGLAAHVALEAHNFTLICEYLAALADFELGEVDFKGKGAEPVTYNVEVGYTTDVANRPVTFALGYQGSGEAVDLGLPEDRYIGTVKMEVLPRTILALEYFHDEDYSVVDGGTGNAGESLTMQLALEF